MSRRPILSRSLLTIALLLCLAATLPATVITGVTEAVAGSLPGTAQDLTGVYVTQIYGTLATETGVSMFRINILDQLAFAALTVPVGAFTIPDTELFLFDQNGYGIYANDDISGSDTLSCLPAVIGNPCATSRNGTGPVLPGIYYLAITRSANTPLDSNGNPIFSFASSTDVVAANSGVGPIASWDGGVFTNPDYDLIDYQLDVTEATPEPASWLLMAGAGLGLALLRKRIARS